MDSEKPAVSQVLAKPHAYSKRVVLKTILCREDGGKGLVGERVVIGGWVKSSKEVKKEPIVAQPSRSPDVGKDHKGPGDVSCVELLQSRLPFFRSIMKVFGASSFPLRETVMHHKPAQPSIAFLQVSDGSCVGNLQVLVSSSLAPPALVMPTGTCILVSGILRNPSMEGKHIIELMTERIFHIGPVDHDKYPLSKKRLPVDALREFCHFRPRTTTVASAMRIRDSLGFATHVFFHNNGFISVDAPIITTTDCEGSSEKFHVTTSSKTVVPRHNMRSETIRLEEVKAAIQEKTKRIEELKRSESNNDALAAAIQDLGNTNELALHLESKEKEKTKLGSFLKAEKENSEAYFPGETYLTVSGRFHLESYAGALGSVYSFGPRFRAARSNSSKQVAEMWMVEAEMAFSNLEDVIRCADDYLKFLCKSVLENCKDDMNFILKRIDKASIDRLQSMTSTSFEKISYTEAVEAFKETADKTQHLKIDWGAALSEEHLSYLVEEIYKRPVIVYNHPKGVKPFYIRLNDDGKTVSAFDLVVPKVGTLITGSLNEERINRLDTRIKEMELPNQEYEWYMDLRRHGTVMHSGFSFRFDLMVLFATGLNDVKDVIPFPRSHGKANN